MNLRVSHVSTRMMSAGICWECGQYGRLQGIDIFSREYYTINQIGALAMPLLINMQIYEVFNGHLLRKKNIYNSTVSLLLPENNKTKEYSCNSNLFQTYRTCFPVVCKRICLSELF